MMKVASRLKTLGTVAAATIFSLVMVTSCSPDPAPMVSPKIDKLTNRVLAQEIVPVPLPGGKTASPGGGSSKYDFDLGVPMHSEVKVEAPQGTLYVSSDVDPFVGVAQAHIKVGETPGAATVEFILTGGKLFGKQEGTWADLGEVSGYVENGMADDGGLRRAYASFALFAIGYPAVAPFSDGSTVEEAGSESVDGKPTKVYTASGEVNAKAWVNDDDFFVQLTAEDSSVNEKYEWKFTNLTTPISITAPM